MSRSASSRRSALQRAVGSAPHAPLRAGQPHTAARLRPLTAQSRRGNRDRLPDRLLHQSAARRLLGVRWRRQQPAAAVAAAATDPCRTASQSPTDRRSDRCARDSTHASGGPRPSAPHTRTTGRCTSRGAHCPRRTDTRYVVLILTDFDTFSGGGAGKVPVRRFAGFYVTGWSSASNRLRERGEQRASAARNTGQLEQGRGLGSLRELRRTRRPTIPVPTCARSTAPMSALPS